MSRNQLNIYHSVNQQLTSVTDDCAYYRQSNLEEEWKDHLELANKARQNYREDSAQEWPVDTAVFASDLQKTLLLPYLHDLKVCMFTSRLITFNETFARMEKEIFNCLRDTQSQIIA